MTPALARSAFAAAIVTAAAPAARADHLDPPPRARQLSDLGRTLHARGEYEAALEAFKEAYTIAPSPGLLFNMAQAHRLRGDCSAAAELYRRFIATEPPAEARGVADKMQRVVEGCLVHQANQIAGRTEYSGPVSTNFVTVDRDDGLRKRRIGIGLGGAGMVSFATAALFALDAQRARREVEAAYEQGTPWREIADVDARGRRSSTLATVFAIGGAAATLGGGALYVLGRREGRANDRATVSFQASSLRDATVGMTWPF